MIKEEIMVLQNIVEKLVEKFPNLMPIVIEEFEVELELSFEKYQNYFTGWLFCDYKLNDGKTIPQLIKQTVDLTDKEREIIENISNVILGYFEFLEQKSNIVRIKDILTKIEYDIEVIDLDYKLKKDDILEAKLVKNFDNNLFFFGTFALRTIDKEGVYNMVDEYLGGEI